MNIVVSNNGKIVSTELYDWNENTKTFSTNLSELVLDFGEINGVTIKCGIDCTINCGWNCTINSSYSCTINSGSFCTINSGDYCTINCGYYCTIKCGYYCTINSGDSCTINSGSDCTINSDSYCTIRTYWDTIIFPKKNCSIHYCYEEINTVDKLIPEEFQQILKTGELIKLTEIKYTEILYKENVFTYVLKENQKINFYIDDKFNEELISAILSDNHSKILMLENENNNQFIKHFIKTFKKVN